MPKYTEAQREEIRGIISELYLLGAKPRTIREYLLQKKGYELELRAIQEYLVDVREEVRQSSKFSREEQLGKAMQRLEDLYLKAEQDKDHRLALVVQREINMLLGLNVPPPKADASNTLEGWLRQQGAIGANGNGTGAPISGSSAAQPPAGLLTGPASNGKPVDPAHAVPVGPGEVDLSRPPESPVGKPAGPDPSELRPEPEAAPADDEGPDAAPPEPDDVIEPQMVDGVPEDARSADKSSLEDTQAHPDHDDDPDTGDVSPEGPRGA